MFPAEDGVAMEWFEDETLWAGFTDVLFSPGRAAEAADRVASSPLLRVKSGAEVLDLGCGPGTYAIPFAGQGAAVTGVDLDAGLLARVEAAGAGVRAVRADMREFVEPGRYELAISMYTSFGLFADPADNLRVARNVRESLAPGGVFLIDLYAKEILARDGAEPKIIDVDGGTLVVRGTIIGDWERFRDDFILIRDGVASTAHIEHTLYSAVELKGILVEAGFTEVEAFGGFDGEPYNNHAKRLIVRGRR